MPLGHLVFDLPSQRSHGTCETSKAGSETEVWGRSDSQAAFFLGGGGGRESIRAAKLGGGSWKSLPSPAGWRGEPVRSRAASAVGDRARCQLFASPLPLSFCELRRGYHSPAWGCRAFKEMFLFMQRCQISYASWHGVTAFMPPCLSLLTPISFYHCAAPWSFSAGFMFQPDCV